ncbi:hypothetical protein PQ465_14965 [Sphingobacterium oryzagri]|uniref:Uncharacterized protein n=1 Tax=Sphingobacterium oryzagri TaxID=3025669 RepID=A0ABY7WG61_9SPHI|nr:hypothetical protein [Sphingobacterium sp. KACC 22765]WDF67599.1 hypothetical protein PQ465_14965 [Sphingobacterium sp. KACC 22765]
MEKKSQVVYTDSGKEILFQYVVVEKDKDSFVIADIDKEGEHVPDIRVSRPAEAEHPSFVSNDDERPMTIVDENSPLMKFCRLVLADELGE